MFRPSVPIQFTLAQYKSVCLKNELNTHCKNLRFVFFYVEFHGGKIEKTRLVSGLGLGHICATVL